MQHRLKTLSKYYKKVKSNEKPFEVRINDRPYQVGDILELAEIDDVNYQYTGDVIKRKVTYILDDPQYVIAGYVIMGLSEV